MNKIKALVITLCILASPLSVADPHRDAAYKLLDSMEFDTLMSETIDAMLDLQLQQNPALKPYKQTMREFFSLYFSGESLREDFASMYEEAFTEQELLSLSEFYNSSIGKKSLEVIPTISAQGAALGERRVRENAHILQRMIEKEAQRIQSLQDKN